jgi:hypothetical protein
MITLAVSLLSDENLKVLYETMNTQLKADRLAHASAGLWTQAILNEKDDRNLKWTI